MSIETFSGDHNVYSASDEFKKNANFKSQDIYTRAKESRLAFWEEQAEQLHWFKKWDTVLEWNRPYAKWFKEGQLNACYNCVDVHANNSDKANKQAIIWEGENGDVKTYTYAELSEHVQQTAHMLKHQFNVQKGDRVTIYMPMIPELVFSVLACARLGAIHSVVFGGFSAKSLRDRIEDSQSQLVITADGGYRRGQIVPLKDITDEALKEPTPVTAVVVMRHIGESAGISWNQSRDFDFEVCKRQASARIEPEVMVAEDKLFILYTSGTTGKPKGIIHTTGGYLTHAKFSTKAVFDLKDSDVYWCTADVGWITGHTYLVYGPLANGATALMYEGSPDFPDKDRFWDIVDKHQVSIFYTAPTAIRAFMKWGDDFVTKHSLSSLRLLGTVGEPINPEAWEWYHKVIGKERCPIVDTWWQTETGGIMISNLPALNDMKPGCAGLTLPGIEAEILNQNGDVEQSGGGLLSLTQPWPSMLRGIWGDPKRYEEVYWSKFDTYFAGDGAVKGDDGYFMVLGRVDDVLNVAGHRIGTMEVESCAVDVEEICECAVVGTPDEIKGQAILPFVILREGFEPSKEVEQKIIDHICDQIGPIAKPKRIIFTHDLPKTRSGKIMRRILKNIANNEDIGDCTTLSNPQIVDELIGKFKEHA